MVWQITEVVSDDQGQWAIKYTNVSSETLSTDDYFFMSSTQFQNSNGTISIAERGSATVAPGGSFYFGDTDLAETDIGQPGFLPVTGFDLFAISSIFSPNLAIDSVGDRDGNLAYFEAGLRYEAVPGRVVDQITNNNFTTADFTSSPYCFLEGTEIDTPDGPRRVETLEIGDLVLTEDSRRVPVRFNFHQRVMTRFNPADHLRPVRVAAGALGNGLPRRDLMLTADHALYLGGVLVNAGALVNGTSVAYVPLHTFDGGYTVYHVETEGHDLLLAEGAAAESFIDYAGRRAFDNYAAYLELYGHEAALEEQNLPRITTARALPPHLKAWLKDAAVA